MIIDRNPRSVNTLRRSLSSFSEEPCLGEPREILLRTPPALSHNLREPCHQVLLWPVALEPVAVTAQELEVVDVVGAAA